MRTRCLAEREGAHENGRARRGGRRGGGRCVEVIARLLRSIEVPRNVIDASIQTIRRRNPNQRAQTNPFATRGQLSDVRALCRS